MLENIINAAQGKIKADIVLKNGKIIDMKMYALVKFNSCEGDN